MFRIRARGSLFFVLLLGSILTPGLQADDSFDALLMQAAERYSSGQPAEGIVLATRAIALEPENARGYFLRGRMHEEQKQPGKAVEDFTKLLELAPNAAIAYQLRGAEYFKLGRMEESVRDFDKFLELMPQQAAQHWQRGISLYYAGNYDAGRKQFELHHTVNANDVENAAWHFLCVARDANLQKAREMLLPVERDARTPMMEIYAVFGGKGTIEAVLRAARAGTPSEAELKKRLFYAHLYIGLFHEAAGDEPLARSHLFKAADDYRIDHYMGEVARVHADLLRKKN
jgi:lipoprotein NlpI